MEDLNLESIKTLLRLRNAIKIDLNIYKDQLKEAKKEKNEFHEAALEGKIKYGHRIIDEIDGRMELWAGQCNADIYTSDAF